jgi:hypothetical protein
MYELYHEEDLVLKVEDHCISILLQEKLPFELRKLPTLTEFWFNRWVERRVTHLNRKYMNKLYIQRRVGRGYGAIIADSAAISIVDNFWVTHSKLNHTWESLQELRDESTVVKNVCLEGVTDGKAMFAPKVDHTSNFSIKGAFKKTVFKGHILKKGDNAEYEISGYRIGNHLGISVAKAEVWADGIVACRMFTGLENSMVHAGDILVFDEESDRSELYDLALQTFQGNLWITAELQQLFILHYLVSNFDLHEENFGFLYNPQTFGVIDVAPAYDFNSAFDSYGDVNAYDQTIINKLPFFIANNLHLVPRLRTLHKVLESDIYLTDIQKIEVASRAANLIELATQATGLKKASAFG